MLFERILNWGRPRSGGYTIAAVAFGKHPGWDDHIDDIGLQTQSLVQIKRSLYHDGMAGNIDAGTWERAGAASLPEFDHSLLWMMESSLTIGRIVSSVDGKGRSKYPLVLMVHVENLSLRFLLDRCVEPLERAVEQARKATTAQGLRQVMAELQSAVEAGVNPAEHAIGVDLRGEQALAEVADRLVDRQEALLRIIYMVRSELRRLRSESCGHLRVCPLGADLFNSLALWLRFVAGQLDPRSPRDVLAIAARGQEVVDVFTGRPSTEALGVIRLSVSAVHSSFDVPYQLDSDFVAQVGRDLAASRARV